MTMKEYKQTLKELPDSELEMTLLDIEEKIKSNLYNQCIENLVEAKILITEELSSRKLVVS